MSKFFYTGLELYSMQMEGTGYLVNPILPKTGLAAIVGPSESGKSSLARQLALSIAYEQEQFMKFPLNRTYNKAIYISTEDGDIFISNFLKNYVKNFSFDPEKLKNLFYAFSSFNIIQTIKEILVKHPCDIVIIDSFSDVFHDKDINSASDVRTFLSQYSDIANKSKCLVLFIHHIAKGKEYISPSKNSILGSQGFEAKMRVVLDLRQKGGDHYLSIVKGNYLGGADKKNAFLLMMNENLYFHDTGIRVPVNLIGKKSSNKYDKSVKQQLLLVKARELKAKGCTMEQIAKELGRDKSTISRWLKDNQSYSEDYPPF